MRTRYHLVKHRKYLQPNKALVPTAYISYGSVRAHLENLQIDLSQFLFGKVRAKKCHRSYR